MYGNSYPEHEITLFLVEVAENQLDDTPLTAKYDYLKSTYPMYEVHLHRMGSDIFLFSLKPIGELYLFTLSPESKKDSRD